VTISLDDDLARWARVRAAENDTSLSRFIADILERERCSDGAYERAFAEWLAEDAVPLGSADVRYPSREELYDRPGLR
jgi:hypothetical protein